MFGCSVLCAACTNFVLQSQLRWPLCSCSPRLGMCRLMWRWMWKSGCASDISECMKVCLQAQSILQRRWQWWRCWWCWWWWYWWRFPSSVDTPGQWPSDRCQHCLHLSYRHHQHLQIWFPQNAHQRFSTILGVSQLTSNSSWAILWAEYSVC